MTAALAMHEEAEMHESPQCVWGTEDVEEHPLQWLQPTPPHSPMALFLPIVWNFSITSVRGEAMSSTSYDSATCAGEVTSDASTTVSEEHSASLDEVSDDGSSRNHSESAVVGASIVASAPLCEPIALPPQRTPSIPSMSSPPPPPACFPQVDVDQSSFIVRPRDSDELVSFQELTTAFSTQACREYRPVPTLLEAAGSFTDLSSWSLACDGSEDYAEDRFDVVGHSSTAGQSSQPFVLSRGSSLHDSGKCKPCAFVHRPVGCIDGASCSFCHLCAPGEKKRRQRSKLEAVRIRRELRRAVTSAGSADISGEGKGANGRRAAAR